MPKQIKDELQKMIDSLSTASGSFGEYTKQVEKIINLFETCKQTEETMESLQKSNESLKKSNKSLTDAKTKINNEKLAAEEKLQACNERANKRDVITKSRFKGPDDEKGIELIDLSKNPKKKGGHKSRKPRKSRKSKQTRRVYSLDPI